MSDSAVGSLFVAIMTVSSAYGAIRKKHNAT